MISSLRPLPRATLGNTVLVALPAFMAALCLTILWHGYATIRNELQSASFAPAERELLVRPAPQGLGIGAMPTLDDAMVRRMAELAGIEAVTPRLVLRAPVSVRIGILENVLRSDAPLYGMESEALEESLQSAWSARNERTPVAVSRQLVGIMGGILSDALGYPRLSVNLLLSQPITITIGESTLAPVPGTRVREYPATVAGFSSRVPLFGLTVPTSTLRRIANETGTATSVSDVLVTVAEGSDPAAIRSAISALGLTVDDETARTATMSSRLRTLHLAALVLTALLLCFLAVAVTSATASNVLVHTRTIGIMRAFGARPRDILGSFVGQAMSASAAAGMIGAGLGTLACLLGADDTPIPAGQIMAGLMVPAGITTAAAGLSALPPAIRATRLSPIRALGEET